MQCNASLIHTYCWIPVCSNQSLCTAIHHINCPHTATLTICYKQTTEWIFWGKTDARRLSKGSFVWITVVAILLCPTPCKTKAGALCLGPENASCILNWRIVLSVFAVCRLKSTCLSNDFNVTIIASNSNITTIYISWPESLLMNLHCFSFNFSRLHFRHNCQLLIFVNTPVGEDFQIREGDARRKMAQA